MKILHVIGSMEPTTGGPCEGIRNLNFAMDEAGIEREIATLDDPEVPLPVSDPFPVHPLGPGITRWRYSKKLKPWLEKHMLQFDIVIVNGLWLYHGYATRSIIRKLKKKYADKAPKLFVMPHGMLDPYFQRAPERKWKAIRNWFYWNLVERKLVNEADGLLFTCATELELARQSFSPYRPKRQINVGYGVQKPPLFKDSMRTAFEQKCPSARQQPYILFLSRIHEKKGVDLLVDAWEKIGPRIIEASHLNYKLVIAGPGLDTSFGRKLTGKVHADNFLSETVFFPGMLMGEAKWGAFYGCEAFILPSHQENFGIAVVEAMACRKAVLISDQVNIWREINEDHAGLIENDTSEGVEHLLLRWVAMTPEKKKLMTEDAEKSYKKRFTVEFAAKNLITTLRNFYSEFGNVFRILDPRIEV